MNPAEIQMNADKKKQEDAKKAIAKQELNTRKAKGKTTNPTTKDGKYKRYQPGQEQYLTETDPERLLTETLQNEEDNTAKNEETSQMVEQAKDGLKGVPGALTEANGYGEDEYQNQLQEKIKKAQDEAETTPEKKNERAYSIWDAYNKGQLSKEGATYYTIDAISNFLRNTGRSIGNIGAQYTGGTVDNNYDESQWSQRNKALNAEEAQIAREQMGGQASRQATREELGIVSQKLANASQSTRNAVMQYAANRARNAKSETERLQWMRLAANGGQISAAEGLGFGVLSDLKNFLNL